MSEEIAVNAGELADELPASWKPSLVIAQNNSKCQYNRGLLHPALTYQTDDEDENL